jgi:LacI family transcriptional regulator
MMGVESGYRLALELLKLPARPTAILATNNRMLLGLTRAAAELQIPIPTEVSVIGFDNSAWTENFHPRLTTVAQATRQIGEATVRLILDQINAPEARPPERMLVRAEILLRESTAPAYRYEDMIAAARPTAAGVKESP